MNDYLLKWKELVIMRKCSSLYIYMKKKRKNKIKQKHCDQKKGKCKLE